MKTKKIIGYIGLYFLLAVMLLITLFPIYWVLVTAIKPNAEMYNIIPNFWPENPTLAHLSTLFGKYKFAAGIKNSLIVSIVVSAVTIVFSFLAAYALARLKFRGRGGVLRGILYAYLVPKAVLFIPLYMMVSSLGIANTLGSLILIYPTFTIPYATWMLVSYLKSIPVSLEEAAIIDGCNRWQSMLKIVLPLSMPGVVSTLIISFTLCWNEYLYAMVMIHDKAAKTMPLLLSEMIVGDVFAWGPLMAGAAVASIPILILYLFGSSKMVGGLTVGGVKG